LKLRIWKRIDLVDLIGIIPPILFIVIISIFHYKSNPSGGWSVVWVLSENMLLLSMSLTIIVLSYSGILRNFFKYVFAPYFLVKCIYHIFCYLQIYIMPYDAWKKFWIGIIFLIFILGFIIILYKHDK